MENGTFGIGPDKLKSRKANYMCKIVIFLYIGLIIYFEGSKEPSHRVPKTYMFWLKKEEHYF